jgi:polyhydroxyalkanoate synthesis regulator phasin
MPTVRAGKDLKGADQKMFLKTKIATGAVAGVLTLAMTGAAAMAAFQPAGPMVSAAVRGTDAQVSAAEREKNTGLVRALEAILERLVRNGTITAEQKTQILAAVNSAETQEDGARHLKRIWNGLMGLSVTYLGLTKTEVNTALRAGTSLGALADTTEGKSRDGLIGALAVGVTALIDQAVADGKITEERAATAEAELLERITKFVDHVYEQKAPSDRAKEQKERTKELKERAKERTKELKERAKERIKELKERIKEKRAERKAEQGEEQDQDD